MKKYSIRRLLTLSIAFIFSVGLNAYSQEKDYDELKKEYEALLVDRDNILAQTKNLLQYKERYLSLQKDIEELQAQNSELNLKVQDRDAQIQMLQEQVEELEESQVSLVEEREDLKDSLDKLKIEYKILPETRKNIAELKKENTELLKNSEELEAKIQRLEEVRLDAVAQAEIYLNQLNEFKQRYEEAVEKNRTLEKEVAQAPKKFAELARENKILIKQTALMHYNLGIFYTQNKQYSRAIAEFEKSLELNPDDPYAHYNLGYIYAEYLVNRPKAIEHFRHFLRLAKSDDKDVDWVKKYILTWQTWEGKEPMQ